MQHPWVVAACNFVLVMVIYTLSRLFFYAINADLFSHVSVGHLVEMCVGGLRFDLTALLFLNMPYLLMELLPLRLRANRGYQRTAQWLYWLFNGIGIIVNCADMVYFRFTDRRTTCTFFTEFGNDDNLWKILLTGMVQYWYVTLFALIMLTGMVLFMRRHVCLPQLPKRGVRLRWYAIETLLLLVSVYFVVIGIRGGFAAYTRPITVSNALQYTHRSSETAIVLNTPFSVLKTIGIQTYVNPHYFTDVPLESIFTPIHQPTDTSAFRPKNVVILILESFSKEYVGFYNCDLDSGTYRGYTPFLDSLLVHARTYTLSLASGRKSIDATPSVLSSIPMLIESYVVTPYATNTISSVAACLRDEGYQTAFYHGAPNGSMGFQAYVKAAGFDRYFGKREYDGPPAFDGVWAIWDEEFLQFYARSMCNLHEPFCTAVFTASSHHPFNVPERYRGVFPKGTQPIHQCIGYSDNALRHFFNAAKRMPWYANTLFVLTADHTNQLVHPRYTTAKGVYEIPIAFFVPGDSLQGIDSVPISQVDIMPSVLGYLGYNKPFFAFGSDVLSLYGRAHVGEKFVVNYNNSIYQVFSNHLLVQFDGTTVTAVYDFCIDPLLQHNLCDTMRSNAEVKRMTRYLKAYIQQYIVRMTENRLTLNE